MTLIDWIYCIVTGVVVLTIPMAVHSVKRANNYYEAYKENWNSWIHQFDDPGTKD